MSTRKSTQRSRIAERRRKERARQRRTWLVVIGVVLIAISYSAYTASSRPVVSQDRLEDSPIKGAPEAPITITLFSDFGCESCMYWHLSGNLDAILETYEGQVNLEWRDFPVISPGSPLAAQAGQCAHDQGKFWDFHDTVFERQEFNALSESDLLTYAQRAGLAMDPFQACLDTNQHRATIDYDLQAGRELALRGTPAFLVEGQIVFGATPSLLVTAIQQALTTP